MFLKILLSLIIVCSIARSSPIQFGNVIRDLYGNSTADMIMMANEWTITGLISNSSKVGQYNGSPVLGGPQILGLSGSLQRSYTSLPMHNVIYFDIGVKMIGHWKNYVDTFTFKVDGQRINTFYVQIVGTSDAVGNDDLDTRLIGNFPHTSSSITLSFTFELKSANSNGTFAINDLSLSFKTSPSPSASSLLTLVDSMVNSSQTISGITGCPSGFYNHINLCLLCDESCQDCFGPSSSQCFQCTWSYSLIGDQCLQCPSNCSFCSENSCLLCNPGFTLDFDGTCTNESTQVCPQGTFLMWNDTCSSSCLAPLVQETRNEKSFCSYPCNANEYLYANGSCLNSCIYHPVSEDGCLFCRLQCQNYIYQNDTCLPSCPAPYIQGDSINGKTCTFPCPVGQYLFDNVTCSAECPSPYIARVETVGQFCSFPCNSNQFLYQNGSCLLTCPFPYISVLNAGTLKLCNPPCPANNYYYSLNGSCFNDCKTQFRTVQDGILYCDNGVSNLTYCVLISHPNDNTTTTNCTEPTRTCPSGYFLFEDFTCNKICPEKFTPHLNATCSSPCGLNSALYPNGSCSPSCTGNFTPRKQGNFTFCDFSPPGSCKTNEYLYANGSCLNSCIYNPITENGYLYCRLQCQNFIYQNNTCLSTCIAPYIRGNTTDGNGKTCTFPCAAGKYLFVNGTCSAQCPTPYISRIEPEGRFCSIPCSSSQYLFRNGSCLSTCPEGFVFKYQNPTYLCTNPCNSGQYLYQNGSCLSTCRSDFISQISGDEMFCNFPCEYLRLDFLYPNGTCTRFNCFGDFIVKSDGMYQSCIGKNGCQSPLDYNYKNGTCSPSCPAPFVIVDTATNGRKCFSSCPTGQYLFNNGTCTTSCPNYYIVREDGLCSYPCSPSEYLFRNGSCLSTCPDGFVFKYQSPNYFCTNPCSSGKYLYQNGSCLSTCRSDFISQISGDEMLCNFPCEYLRLDFLYPNGTCTRFNCFGDFIVKYDGMYQFCIGKNGCQSPLDYKYQNGTCSSSCPAPFIIGNSTDGRKCFLPCPSGQYLLANGTCITSCPKYYIVREDGLCSYPCSSNQYLFRNGSCLSTCPEGFVRKSQSSGVYFCTNPCSSGQYLYQNGSCLSTCRSDFISKISGDEMLCNFPCEYLWIDYLYPNGTCSRGSCFGDFITTSDGTYQFCKLNPLAVNKCPIGFLYQDGSCREYCSFPYISILDAGATKLCNLPCSANNYYYSLNGTCVNDCEIEYRTTKDGILYCDGGIYNYTYCVLTTNIDKTTTTNCTDATGTCLSTYFLFEDNTCNKVCPDKFTPRVTATCSSPCGLNSALYPNGSCLPSCTGDFTTRMEGNFMFCDASEIPVNTSYTAVLEIYIRYDITVSDFYDQSGITKFLQLLATLFGIDISQITILNIREGSTIIESKVTLTSDSDSKSKATTNSKIQTMNQTFENAAQANNLNLEDIKVLNYSSSVVIPVSTPEQGITPEQGHIQVEESSSKAVVIGVAVGAVLAVIAVGITVYSVYRRRQKHKLRRVAKSEAYKVDVNPAVDQQERNHDQSKDEEFYGLAHASIIQIKENTENNVDQTQNRIEPFESARKDFESHQPDPLEKIEEASGCKEETLKSNGIQELEEVEDQKAMSLNEIMKKIEAEVNGENPIELNFED